MVSIVKVDTLQNLNSSNIITQANATTITIGASGQTITIPSGTTFNASSASVNLPAINLATGVTGTLPIANGGTNLTTYTTGDLLYASNATTLTKLGIGSAGQGLVVSGGIPAWGTSGPSAGQVIQVVTATDSTDRTITSESYVTGSNTLSVTITPSSTSNKIFVIASLGVLGNTYGRITLYRNGSTNLGGSGTAGMAQCRSHDGNAVSWSATMSYLDSPSTTSATTYQVYAINYSTEVVLNYNGAKGSITAFEIKG